jgi:hypothetical protein
MCPLQLGFDEDAYARYVVVKEPGHQMLLENRTCGCMRVNRLYTDSVALVSADPRQMLLRKEVIQPHLPVRLPCYDFTPITSPRLDGSLLTVGSPASSVANFRGVTGGVYKARERIHGSLLICHY